MHLKTNKYVSATVLVLSSIIVTLAIAEVALRYTLFAGLRPPAYGYPTGYFAQDDVLGYDIMPNVTDKMHGMLVHSYPVFSNQYGCFDKTRDVPQDYTLVIGDSMTWGYTQLDKKWTTRLEELSGEFLLKCGVTGYGTLQELRKARKVIEQVGHAPKRIIALYFYNDLNDDYLFPQRKVVQGNLVSYAEKLNLKTGEITRRDEAEIAKKIARYQKGSVSNWWREFKEGLVVYQVIRNGQRQLERKVAEAVDEEMAPKDGELPKYSINSVYGVMLSNYLDTDRPWFNDAVKAHQRNLLELVEYADSINAKLMLIDAHGTLLHPRFEAVQARFANAPHHDYYNLKTDYPVFDIWDNDLHWNIVGNQKAGGYIHSHAQQVGFFKD